MNKRPLASPRLHCPKSKACRVPSHRGRREGDSLQSCDFLTAREVAARLGRCVDTIYRWATKGMRGFRLETIRIGGTLCTSHEALQRFFDRLTEADPAVRADAGGAPPLADEGVQ